MLMYRNISPCWESTAEHIDDTPYEGILHLDKNVKALELENPDTTQFLDIDVVLVEPSLKHGAKLYWDGHLWCIDHVERGDGVRVVHISRKNPRGKRNRSFRNALSDA